MTPPVVFTEHAVERYRERVKPGLDREGAIAELQRLTDSIGEVADRAPDWVFPDLEAAHTWLLLGDSVALALAAPLDGNGPRAVTCLTTGTPLASERHRRKLPRARAKKSRRDRDRVLRGRRVPVQKQDQWWAAGERPTETTTEGADDGC